MKKFSFTFIISFILLLSGCSTEEANEYERVTAKFTDSLGVSISTLQWWETSVKLKINLTTDKPITLMLLSSGEGQTVLYDYKEVESSGTVTMTAPQGKGNTLNLKYLYNKKLFTQEITLSGNPEEIITLNTTTTTTKKVSTRATHPASLSGSSIAGNAEYYEFSSSQLVDYYKMMDFSKTNEDAKVLGLNCNYELESQGPFSVVWVNGYEAEQHSRILGYYYHSPTTWKDIKYVDLSETHKWDYIDGLSKVQYQISINDVVDGHEFIANTWYDANFDLTDTYGATSCANRDRVGDNAYNSQVVYTRYGSVLSALRGISFKIDVPAGMRIGFYLRSDEEPDPEQWTILKNLGIPPYVENQYQFKGTCFCAEFMNIAGNGRGYHRSFIKDFEEVYWMGMEDLLNGGDHDCNDVIFGVVSDLKIHMPTIIDPELAEPEDDIDEVLDETKPFPWTIAYEDVYRDADFDFNDAVIKLEPDYVNELCCVTVMAAGSTSRMYLHYDGPDGDEILGEVHELLGSKNSQTYINTQGAIANTPFVQIDCVPWPKDYTMANDAKRFYIEVQRGTCKDCTDLITLAQEPGQLPQALLVAGEWQWPLERVHINSAYSEFSKWAHDVTRTRFWEWYKTPEYNTAITY